MNYLRGDLRDQLAYVGHDVVRAGLVVGSGGNLSARLSDGDSCWVTASGTWLDRLDRASFVRVRISDGATYPAGSVRPAESVHRAESVSPSPPPTVQDGTILLDGVRPPAPSGPTTPAPRGPTTPGPRGPTTSGPMPTSEVGLHLATYRARPDVQAIVHLHPQTVLLLDALGERIRLVTTDHGFYLRRVARVPFRAPGTTELAELAAEAARDGTNCLVLSQHGCSVLGDSVELAHKRAANLEEAARLTYRALAAGRLDDLPDCPAEFLARTDDSGSTSI
ncbi:class II aldolase/adducin family protein [Plantactinospora sp. S1510]|uniref:Class II aldolase/adducin family protein n=1 Tax=Plantactinospora alkalitolerans TaxID=2789879 RepID=A0ABS0GXK8_9ACTN|nr:class II aldolase/adducin family protein [Plantactinospora alkalitolerans]MBF9130718.1 class II aldolase/adducin family protein [Plantactinospora alkalitolerans]